MPLLDLSVNGQSRKVEADDNETLLSVLRNRLDLTGAKYGCGEAQCGACAVLIDGRLALSCVTPAAGTAGQKIVTIEGLARRGNLHPVQQAFLESSAFQCGYCTPGMILAAVALLDSKPKPSEAETKDALNGHICRCGAYPRIVEAVRMAAARMAR